jgi:hypothetical protein
LLFITGQSLTLFAPLEKRRNDMQRVFDALRPWQ